MRFSPKELVMNFVTARTAWLRKLIDPRRDIEAECGHPEEILIKDYQRAYDRDDVARRVVSVMPEESWSESPVVVEEETGEETAFEEKWAEINDKFKVWHCLQRADILSGIGRFGILLLGFNDGRPLREPLPEEASDLELTYLRPFEEYLVDVSTLEIDVNNPRYGLPVLYTIRFVDTATQTGAQQTAMSVLVHHSRVIHLADNRTNSDVYGTPRMKPVFNRLLDLKKIAGGSGEMFWKGGFPGLALQAALPGEDVAFDKEATQEQMEKYYNGLQRYFAVVGMEAKSLAPQVADPTPHIDSQLKLISVALSCPWRIFIGSEAAQLASSQDARAWNKRINRRRKEYITPFIIRPFIEKLMSVGVLPKIEKYVIKWADLNTPGDEEKALVAERRTNALGKYVMGGVDALIPPFHYLTIILGMTDEEANGVLQEGGDRFDEVLEERSQRAMEAAVAARSAAAPPRGPQGSPGRPRTARIASPPIR